MVRCITTSDIIYQLHDEPAQMLTQIQLRLRKLCPIPVRFKIEIDGIEGLFHFQRQRSFPYLTRPQQGNCRKYGKIIQKRRKQYPPYHACTYRTMFPDLQGFLYALSHAKRDMFLMVVSNSIPTKYTTLPCPWYFSA